jgi:hypothetical protein
MKIGLLTLTFAFGVTFTSCDDERHNTTNIVGTWSWQSTCGGVVGCLYATSTNHKILRITDTMMEYTENGKITGSEPYTINSVTVDHISKTYEIEVSNGGTLTVSVQDSLLIIEALPITSVYKRP